METFAVGFACFVVGFAVGRFARRRRYPAPPPLPLR